MDIVEVVGQYTTLHRKGVNYVGLCPLHQDRSVGSFAVDPRRNICSCWACGKTGLDPIAFLQEKEHYSYEQALKWLAKLKHIDVEGNDIDIKIEPRKELPPLETIYIERHHVKLTNKQRNYDTLVQWLRSLKWSKEQRERMDGIQEKLERSLTDKEKGVLWLYAVGQWIDKDDKPYTVFWQVDEQNRIHSGKLMTYKTDGHRNKDIKPTFVHAELQYLYPKDKYKYVPTLFGMHLLNRFPGQTVNIVESEKTALIMSIAYGTLWMATGGLENLKREILQPIIDQGRDIILYPDKDGIESWKYRQKVIGYERMAVNTDILRKCWTEADGPKADIADIVVRLISAPTTEQDIIHKYPGIEPLIDKLELEIV